MPSIPHPRDVPGLEAVAAVLRRAEQAVPSGPPFTVCICDVNGVTLASAELASFDAVKRFSREMASVGYAAEIHGELRPGCDVTYKPQEGARDIFDDGGIQTDPVPL